MRTVLRLSILAVFITLTLVVQAPDALASEKAAATKFIDRLNDSAFNVLQSQRLSPDQKETAVRKLLSENFDFNLIGKFVLGSSWRKATGDQRKEYLSLFKEYVLAIYTRRLVQYSGQKIQVVGAKAIGKRDVLVITILARPSGPPLKANWRVRSNHGEHQILDVVVAGVSMVVTQRSDFRSIIRRQGVDGLIKKLRIQVAEAAPNR